MDCEAYRFKIIEDKLSNKGLYLAIDTLCNMINFIDDYVLDRNKNTMERDFIIKFHRLFGKEYLKTIFSVIKRYIDVGWEK